jgi:hypothetical protein
LKFLGNFSKEFLEEFFGRNFLGGFFGEDFFGENFLGGIIFCIGIDFGFCQDFVSRQKKEGRKISIFRSASTSSSHLKNNP